MAENKKTRDSGMDLLRIIGLTLERRIALICS